MRAHVFAFVNVCLSVQVHETSMQWVSEDVSKCVFNDHFYVTYHFSLFADKKSQLANKHTFIYLMRIK